MGRVGGGWEGWVSIEGIGGIGWGGGVRGVGKRKGYSGFLV